MNCKSVSLLVIGSIMIATLAQSFGAEEPYRGETIQIITGGSPGGGYDTYARTIARHISKHIPGQLNIVVSNMPGAGALVAANYMYNKARSNGLILGTWNSAFVLYHAWATPLQFYRPYSMPPGAPEKKLAIMHRAFQETLKDPDFLKDAERSKLFIHPVTAEKIQGYVEQLPSISPETKEALDFLVRK